jgi:YVTN family beta-propeller protein
MNKLFTPVTLTALFLALITSNLRGEGGHAADDELALAAAQIAKRSIPGAAAASSTTTTLAAAIEPADSTQSGSWGAVINWTPHIPVSAANLPDGRILTFASNQRTSFPVGPEFTYAATWDPATGVFQEVNHPSHDMFCGGITLMPDGRVMVNGGRNETTFASVFDWRNNTWTRIQNMNGGRWYNTSVSMPNGNVFTATGSGTGINTTERWSPSGWTVLTGMPWPTILGSDAGYFKHWHPFMSVAPDGRVLHFGPTDTMHWLTPTGAGSFVNAGTNVPGTHYPKEGCFAMYDEGKVLVAGGSINTASSPIDGSIGISTTASYIVNMNTNPPTATVTGSMAFPRQFANAVVLPSGEVLVMGGNSPGVKFSDQGSILPCEIWSPRTGTWRTVASISVPRNYHSLSLLLPDGRVMAGGGGLGGGDHRDAQLYTPPSLFTASGTAATRPILSAAPSVIAPNSVFTVAGTPGLAKFSLIRMAALTHSVNTDQRYLSVPFTETSAGNYQLTAHANTSVLLPGYWMLFGINSTGAYSVSKIILVNNTSGPLVTNPGDQTSVIANATSLQLSSSTPAGTSLTYSATGLPPGLTLNSVTGLISGTPSTLGTFNVQIAVTATQAGFGSSSQNFTWTIYPSSASFTFNNFTGATGLSVNLNASITSSVLRLTTTAAGQAGSAYLTSPVAIGSGTSFTSRFNFRIGGGSGADGFAFVIQGNSNNAVGGAGGYLGYLGVTKSLAVEFDEYLNNGDPNGNHIGVLTNGNVETHLAIHSPTFNLQDNVSHTAWVDYDGATKTLRVFLSQAVTAVQPATPVITLTNIDIPSLVGTAAWFGFSGGTGGLTNNHDIESWNLSVLAVGNRPPTLANPGPLMHVVGSSVSFNTSAVDLDSDPVTYSASGLPTGLSINANTGVITGTPTATGTFNSTVNVTDGRSPAVSATFVWTINPIVNLNPPTATPPSRTGVALNFTGGSTGGANVRYKWSWGDGTADTAFSNNPAASHTFASPGRFQITLTATDDSGRITTSTFYQGIHAPLSTLRPTSSSSIAFEDRPAGTNDRVWCVNPDNDSVSVFDAVTRARTAEISVGNAPRALAIAPDGRIWVSNVESSTVSVVSPSTLAVVQTLTLARASRPFGIAFDPDGTDGWIACEGTGLLLRMNPTTGAQSASLNVGLNARHVSVTANSSRVLVSRFITPQLPGENTASINNTDQTGGEVVSVLTGTLTIEKTTILTHSTRADTITTGRGIPNYLGPAVISPDGLTAWVPSKQDNIKRGMLRDGSQLTHDQTVRSVASRIVLTGGIAANTDDMPGRVDFDNAGIASNGSFERTGIYFFTALEGSREIGVVDVWGKKEIKRFSSGRAPQGVVTSPDGRTLYSHNFMDRTITVHDVGPLLDGADATPTLTATLNCVTTERLSPTVLLGKKHFYDAADSRIAFQQYISCASCHNDGAQDGRTWDFTGFGEGLRNTITLRGHGGTAHGPLHWTGNFDEVQDFENQIRNLNLGTGLINGGNPHPPMGTANAGRSADLDALAAYVTSLSAQDVSPFRNANGTLTTAAVAGRTVFENSNCAQCHSGVAFTNSALNVAANIGTIKSSTGNRLGNSLTGLDVPTLRGLWATGPYLHDGSAATLAASIQAHQGVNLSATDLSNLVSYLQQIDAGEVSAPSLSAPVITLTGPASSNGAFDVIISSTQNVTGLTATDFTLSNGTASTLSGSGSTYALRVTPTSPGTVTVSLPAGRCVNVANIGNAASNSLTINFVSGALVLTSSDVGPVFVPGTTSVSGGNYTLTASGEDIYFNEDGLRFAYQQVTGDGEIIARVTSQTLTNDWAKAGVMIRETLTGGSRHATAFTTPLAAGNGFGMVWRSETNGATDYARGPDLNAAPNNWVRLVRSGANVTAYASANGTSWTEISSTTLTSLPSTVYFGLALSAGDNYSGAVGTGTFDNVSINGALNPTAPTVTLATSPTTVSGAFTVTTTFNQSVTGLTASDFLVANGTASTLTGSGTSFAVTITPTTAGAVSVSLPAGSATNAAGLGNIISDTINATFSPPVSGALTGVDVGRVLVPGSTSLNSTSGLYTITASGDDIYFNADGFHFAQTRITGDGEIRARVNSQTNTNDWAKAGVMIRETLTAGSRHSTVFTTPASTGNGFGIVSRLALDGATTYQGPRPMNAPPNNWVRLVRSGNTLTGFASSNGTNWTQIGTTTFSGLSPTLYFGLVVTATDDYAATTSVSTFDNVQITGAPGTALASRTAAKLAAPTSVPIAEPKLQLSLTDESGMGLSFIKPTSSGVRYELHLLSDLSKSPSGWRKTNTQPTITPNGSGEEKVSYSDLSREFPDSDKGFARIHIEQDTNGDGFADSERNGEVFGFTRTLYPVGTATVGNSFATSPIGSGVVGTIGPSSLTFDHSISFVGYRSCYAEVTKGKYAGHRFEIDEAASNGSTIAIESKAPQSTLRSLPTDLIGDTIAFRTHRTVSELFPENQFTGQSNMDSADRILFHNGIEFEALWLRKQTNGSQRWVKEGDSTFSDAGSRIVGVTEGLLIQIRNTPVTVTFSGIVRQNPVALPMKAGVQLTANPWPNGMSPNMLGMTAANGFAGSQDSSNADQIHVWKGDSNVGATGYSTYFLLKSDTLQYWTTSDDVNLTNSNEAPLLPSMRAVFIKSTNDKPLFTPPMFWTP